MDPVKEKLNQLKKLASERKAAHIQNKHDAHEQEKFVKFVRNKLNNFIGNGKSSQDIDQKKLLSEKQKNLKLQYQKSVESIQKERDENFTIKKSDKLQKELETIIAPEELVKREEARAGSIEANSLIVYDDDMQISGDLSKKNPKLESKTRSISIDNGVLSKDKELRIFPETVDEAQKNIQISSSKQSSKSLNVNNHQQNSNSKYIDRIKNLYDKECTASIEPVVNKNLNKFPAKQKQLSLQEETIFQEDPDKNLVDKNNEVLNSSENNRPFRESSEKSSLGEKPKPPRNYVLSLLETFNSNEDQYENQNEKSDLEKLMEQSQNSNIQFQNTNNLFNKLREKFVTNQSDSRFNESFDRQNSVQSPLSISQCRHSSQTSRSPSMIESNHTEAFPVQSLENSVLSTEAQTSKSQTDASELIESKQSNMSNQTKSSSENKSKPKYKKTDTINLSEYIFDMKDTESMNIDKIKAIKFDKFDKMKEKNDLLYMAENNRIRLTLGKYDDDEVLDSNNSKLSKNSNVAQSSLNKSSLKDNQVETNRSQGFDKDDSLANFNKVRKSEPVIQKPTKDELLYLAENNRIRLTLGKYGEDAPEFIKDSSPKIAPNRGKNLPAINKPKEDIKTDSIPVVKKTKSILKPPSNLAEKTLCFDEKIDVISIDSNDNSSIPSFSTNSSRLSPSSQNYLKVPHMESSHSSRQQSLEISQNKVNRESPLRSSLKKSGSSNRIERNRSPAPVREIPELNENKANFPVNINNQEMGDESPKHNNRNRFIKKKISNRSKSVETPASFADAVLMNKSIEEHIRKTSVPSKPIQSNENYGGMISKNPFIVNNKLDIPKIVISNDNAYKMNRPNLIRQNALNKSLTKSLGDNLNKVHESSGYNDRSRNERPNKLARHHSHSHHNRNRKCNRHRRSNYASSSLSSSLSSESEESLSYSSTESSLTSSSDFSPRQSTLDLQRLVKSRNQMNYNDMNNRMFSMIRPRNAKTEEKQLRYPKYAEKYNYSSDDSVCGIPKPSSRRLCSGSKPFHKSMDELSYTKAHKEIEDSQSIPINQALFKSSNQIETYDNQITSHEANNENQLKSDYMETENNINKNDAQKSNSINRESNMIIKSQSINSNLSNIEKPNENHQSINKQQYTIINGQKVTLNSLGQPIHPGLRSVSRTLPTYAEFVNENSMKQTVPTMNQATNANATIKMKAPSFREQLKINDLNEKAKISSNYHLNLKNQFLPFQPSINSNSNTRLNQSNQKLKHENNNFMNFDQKRISSVSPSNISGFNEKNVMIQQNYTPKSLPSYSTYIAKKNTLSNMNNVLHQNNANNFDLKDSTNVNQSNTNALNQQNQNISNQLNQHGHPKLNQNKSKSFDAGHITNLMSLSNTGTDINQISSNLASGYPSLYDQKQTRDLSEEMPQSAAIQEKLKRFEKNNNENKPYSLSNVSSKLNEQQLLMNDKLKDIKLGRSLIDEDRNENAMNRLVSPRRNSPFETNKENSPFSGSNSRPSQYKYQSPNITPSSSSNQFNQNASQSQSQNSALNSKSNYIKQPSLFLQNMGYVPNKNGTGFIKEMNRSSPGRSLINQPQGYKYSQYSSPTSNYNQFNQFNQFSKATSTPPQINSSLTAATAAASAAVAVAQSQIQPQTNSLKNTKTIKSDYSIAKVCSPNVYSNDNYEFSSLQNTPSFNKNNDLNKKDNNNNQMSQNQESLQKNEERIQREKSLEKQNNFNNQLSMNDFNSLGSVSQAPSIVSKRAALFEQKLEQRNLSPQFQHLDTSRQSSFSRSNRSPSNKITKTEDAEMHSSSGGSIGSLKENKRPISLHDSQAVNYKKLQSQNNIDTPDMAVDSSASMSSNTGRKEPHKLSISEKMKLFTPNTTDLSSDQTRTINTDPIEPKQLKIANNKRTNRFQTQPVSLADFEYANDNYVSQINLAKPLAQQQNQASFLNKNFESNRDNNLNNRINFESRKVSIMDSSMKPSFDDNEMKRSNSRNKASNFTPYNEFASLPVESTEKKTQSPSRENLSDDENKTVMTIQERMAALKKNNNSEWRKSNASSEEGPQKIALSFKQNQMQLKQQLQMATPNSSTPYQLLKNEQKSREVLGSLDNNDEPKEEIRSNDLMDNEQDTPSVPKPKSVKPRSIFNAELEKALSINKTPGSKPRVLSKTIVPDSVLNRNVNVLKGDGMIEEKAEMFSTDSEMDSFFKEGNAVGNNYRYNDLFSSSCGSPKTDENLIDDFDDDFDKIKTGGQMLTQGTRAKPVRKTKSKGNHLKNLQNRTEIKNDYQ